MSLKNVKNRRKIDSQINEQRIRLGNTVFQSRVTGGQLLQDQSARDRSYQPYATAVLPQRSMVYLKMHNQSVDSPAIENLLDEFFPTDSRELKQLDKFFIFGPDIGEVSDPC